MPVRIRSRASKRVRRSRKKPIVKGNVSTTVRLKRRARMLRRLQKKRLGN